MSVDDIDDPDPGHDGALLAPLREVDPPSPPRYRLDALAAAGRRRARHRHIRAAVAGGVAVAAVLAFTGTAVTSYLGDRPSRMSVAEQGYGSYDPLVLRIDPGWLPDGVNSYSAGGESFGADGKQATQSLNVSHVTGTEKRLGITWAINIYLFAPGVGPEWDGPLECCRFGRGRPVDSVQGMPAERLGDPNGYTLSWKYPSGAHATVTVEQVRGSALEDGDTVHIPTGTGFGDRVVKVARKVAENLRIDGHAPLRFPFAMRPLPGQRLVGASMGWFRQPGQKLVTTARLSYAPPTARRGDHDPVSQTNEAVSGVHVDSRVNEGDPTGTGKPSSEKGGRIYLVPHTHGFFLTVDLAIGNAERVADGVRIFGDPRDMSTWRADPIRD